MKKLFILDTNVFLHDPKALEVFSDNEVIIPLSILDELDSAKARPDEVGRNAREIVRVLDGLRKKGSLSDGVKIGNSLVRVELNHSTNVPNGLSAEKTDNRLISTALGLKEEGNNVVVVSKDINLRVKCDALGIKAEDYDTDKIASDLGSIYGGVSTVEVNSETIDKLYSDGSVEMEVEAFENQFVVMKANGSQSGIARYVGKNKFVKCANSREVSGISPRNAEQRMALDLLLDPKVPLVTLVGAAGTGKTLLTTAAALSFVLGGGNSKQYQRLLISRPIQPMGRDIGFLPGDLEDKLRPWMQPIYDSLELLLGDDYHMLGEYKYNGIIQVEPLTYIRGRSIPRSFMIVDEAQNLTAKEIKTIITRMGEDSKIVITGDIGQIDNPYVDFSDNGLTHVVEKFKDSELAGHISLRKGERSKLATLASKIL